MDNDSHSCSSPSTHPTTDTCCSAPPTTDTCCSAPPTTDTCCSAPPTTDTCCSAAPTIPTIATITTTSDANRSHPLAASAANTHSRPGTPVCCGGSAEGTPGPCSNTHPGSPHGSTTNATDGGMDGTIDQISSMDQISTMDHMDQIRTMDHMDQISTMDHMDQISTMDHMDQISTMDCVSNKDTQAGINSGCGAAGAAAAASGRRGSRGGVMVRRTSTTSSSGGAANATAASPSQGPGLLDLQDELLLAIVQVLLQQQARQATAALRSSCRRLRVLVNASATKLCILPTDVHLLGDLARPERGFGSPPGFASSPSLSSIEVTCYSALSPGLFAGLLSSLGPLRERVKRFSVTAELFSSQEHYELPLDEIVAACAQLPRLKHLTLRERVPLRARTSAVTSAPWSSLPPSVGALKLRLVGWIHVLPQLTHLDHLQRLCGPYHNTVQDLHEPQALDGLRSLLGLQSCCIEARHWEQLTVVAALTGLSKLELTWHSSMGRSNLPYLPAVAPDLLDLTVGRFLCAATFTARVRHLAQLTSLKLHKCKLHPQELAKGLEDLPRLSSLSLFCCTVPSRAVNPVADMRVVFRKPSLQHLEIMAYQRDWSRRRGFEDVVLQYFAGLTPRDAGPALESLHLGGMSSTQTTCLHRLTAITSLHRLELDIAAVNSDVALVLNQLTHLKSVMVNAKRQGPGELLSFQISLNNPQNCSVSIDGFWDDVHTRMCRNWEYAAFAICPLRGFARVNSLDIRVQRDKSWKLGYWDTMVKALSMVTGLEKLTLWLCPSSRADAWELANALQLLTKLQLVQSIRLFVCTQEYPPGVQILSAKAAALRAVGLPLQVIEERVPGSPGRGGWFRPLHVAGAIGCGVGWLVRRGLPGLVRRVAVGGRHRKVARAIVMGGVMMSTTGLLILHGPRLKVEVKVGYLLSLAVLAAMSK